MQWKDLFERVILTRGYEYYRDDLVSDLRITPEIIRADVEGSEDYEVEIEREHGQITSMYCSCPYADGGKNCKHMAAVLYAAENQGDKPQESVDIAALVKAAKPEQLRAFLTSLLAEDDLLLTRFQTFVTPGTGKVNLAAYKRQVDAVIRKYEAHGYITWDYVGDFFIEIGKFLEKDVRSIQECGDADTAFELLGYIFLQTVEVELDDDGDLGMFGDDCVSLWTEIIGHAEIAQKRTYLAWFLDHLDGSVIDYMEEYLEQIVMDCFPEDEFLQSKLMFTEQRAAAVPADDNFHAQYERSRWVMLHVRLMEELHLPENEISSFAQQYWDLPDVRKRFVQQYLTRGEHEQAISLLEESLLTDRESRGIVHDHLQQLKSLYHEAGERDKYRDTLWVLLTEHPLSLEDYRELKALYTPAEWLTVREELFASLRVDAAATCYQEEGLWDRLLDYAVKAGVYAVQWFELSLTAHFPAEVLAFYAQHLRNLARRTATRNEYSRWAAMLRHMAAIKGGKKVVRELLAEWREQYSNRPAMMEEIGKGKI